MFEGELHLPVDRGNHAYVFSFCETTKSKHSTD